MGDPRHFANDNLRQRKGDLFQEVEFALSLDFIKHIRRHRLDARAPFLDRRRQERMTNQVAQTRMVGFVAKDKHMVDSVDCRLQLRVPREKRAKLCVFAIICKKLGPR